MRSIALRSAPRTPVTSTATTRMLITRRSLSSASSEVGGPLQQWVHFGVALGAFIAADQILKQTLASMGVKFPASLIGMFGILTGLVGLAATGNVAAAERLVAAARPALSWITRYLPIFYVPPLVVLPLAISSLDGGDLARLAAVVGCGMPFTLVVRAAP